MKSLAEHPRLGLARGLLYGSPVGRRSSARSPGATGRRSFVAALALALSGCISPTLPPDDPPLPEVELLGEGQMLLRGAVPAWPASVLARNDRTGLIFGQDTFDGFYEFRVSAEVCDPLELWYTTGGFRSSPLRFVPAALTDPPLPRSVCITAAQPEPAEADDTADAGVDAE
jgi:hypothetical protein